MAFDGTEGEFIEINDGGDMTKAWRDGDFGAEKAVFFGKDKLQEILNQADCKGIRMYFAINEENEKTLVLVGANEDESDQINGKILDRGRICPIYCSSANALNS